MKKSEFWICIGQTYALGLLAGAVILLMALPAAEAGEKRMTPQLMPAPPAASVPGQTEAGGSWDDSQTVLILTDSGETEEMSMKEYLWRVVAAEMPASFEEEALKAQAVCARTYTLWKMESGLHEGADLCSRSSCCQAYIEREEACARWGELSDMYTQRIASAVAETDGQALTYEGELIQALFFSSSVASTEDAQQVWGVSLPYLVPVDSPEGEEVPNYHSSVVLSAEEFKNKVRESGLIGDLTGRPDEWITGITYNKSGRVAELEIGGISLSGGAARTLFNLRSACFSVEEEDGQFVFSVTGYGHGVGMSQYGANAMAKEGKGWEEIVRHYYTGVEITEQK